MSLNYPLKFKPLYKDYIWGGRNFEKLDKVLPAGKKIAESWEISAHHDGMSLVANGPLEDKTLDELISEFGSQFTGILAEKQYQSRFPLLLKFIDANEWLSVQVHPDDDYSRIHENDLGKTEMWYVMDAEPGATIIYGMKNQFNREEFKNSILNGQLEDLLVYREVKPGDVVYIPAGTVHAAGKGILIAEVQQSSNATYRLYDYNRTGADGSKRPLHIEKGLDAIEAAKLPSQGFTQGLKHVINEALTLTHIIADPHFFVDIIQISGEAGFDTNKASFHALLFTEGSGVIEYPGGTLPIKAGESVLIPAALTRYLIKGDITGLKAYIGDLESDLIKPLEAAGHARESISSSIAGLDRF